MEIKLSLLRALEEWPGASQREIARRAGISVGSAHTRLAELEAAGFAVSTQRGNILSYRLTAKGKKQLRREMLAVQSLKLSLLPLAGPVETAVILAAGQRPDFAGPACLLPVSDSGETILGRSIRCLKESGIRDIAVVAGFCADRIREAVPADVTVIENPRYALTGTMASLAAAAGFLHDRPFLLLEGDLVYEQSLLSRLLQADFASGIVLTNLSGSGLEKYVQLTADGNLAFISKDIRQLNTIAGEAVGISKISPELMSGLLEAYSINSNPYLNYEYLIAESAATWRIPCLKIDDLVWGEVDSAEQYRRLRGTVMPTLAKRENDPRLREAVEQARRIFSLPSPPALMPIGGMTNTSYALCVDREWWVLRIPGLGTEEMISRPREAVNNELASRSGFNAPTRYFDPETGVKVTRLLPDAETLTSASARLPANTEAAARLLRRLHSSGMPMEGRFDFPKELERYEALNTRFSGHWEPDYPEIRARVLQALETVKARCGEILLPCHNDMVPENFVISEGRMWLIDWEYAGFNDPAWDLGAFLLENGLNPAEEMFFLHSYAPEGVSESLMERIRVHMLLQDLLWTVWTWEKEASGCDFGDYGAMRYSRLKENLARWEGATDEAQN